jgi:hypothetical protein
MSETSMNTEAKSSGKTTEPKKQSRVKGKIARIALSALALGGLGAGAYEAYEHMNPGIHQTIDIPSTFDPAALEQRIGPENSIQMTFDEYEKTAPPVWVEQNKTLTIPLPIIFRDNRIPTLHIEKVQNPNANGSLDFINIDGLEQGDILFSPFDGKIQISQGAKNLVGFFLYIKGPRGEEISLYFKTTGLNPLVDLSHPPVDGYIPATVKKGDPIGSLITSDRHKAFNGQIQIDGRNDLSLGSFNLAATPEGKVIEITK